MLIVLRKAGEYVALDFAGRKGGFSRQIAGHCSASLAGQYFGLISGAHSTMNTMGIVRKLNIVDLWHQLILHRRGPKDWLRCERTPAAKASTVQRGVAEMSFPRIST